jgi:hypothetical protein
MNVKAFWFLFCGMLLFSACSKENSIPLSKGDPSSETRFLDDFNTITVSQKFKLILSNKLNEPISARIEFYVNLTDNITISIENGNLNLKDDNKLKWIRDLDIQPIVYLNLHELTKLNIEGSSEVFCSDTLFGDVLEIAMNSSKNSTLNIQYNTVMGATKNVGGITLSGKGTIFSWSCENGGWFNAKNMACHDGYIWHFTKSDCWVSPEKQLQFNLYNIGNLYYLDRLFFYKKEIKTLGKGAAIPYN